MKLKTYIGTKQIQAKSMTREDYYIFRGWPIPKNENPNDTGYLVQYPDNYISWSPSKAFEESYRLIGNLTFGQAIELLKQGYKVARHGWGEGMFIYMQGGSIIDHSEANNKHLYNLSGAIKINSHIDMRLENGRIMIGWTPNQLDMLEDDWIIITEE